MADFWNKRGIVPATLEDIKKHIDEAYTFAANASDEKYGRSRGAAELLTPGQDYAELPGFGGRSAREIIEALPVGSSILDVGCGYGELGTEIMQMINPGVEVSGLDAQKQPGQERLKQVVIGNVDRLSPETFGGKRFDLVVSSALLYHLPDYWGAILRMAHMLKPGGILLASTIPRIVQKEDTGEMCYFRNRNVFDVQGRLVPPEELVELLNEQNQSFELKYGLVRAEHLSAASNVGGQISGRWVSSNDNLNLAHMFYCISGNDLGYVVARGEKEKVRLARRKFVSVQNRYQKEETSRKPFL